MKEHHCTKCGKSAPEVRFARRRAAKSGLQSLCHDCNAKRQLPLRRAYDKRRRLAFPEKIAAIEAVRKAIKAGTLIRPDECSECGKKCKPDGHHDDYDKQLDVRWLCRVCHYEHHRNEKA